MDDDDRFLISPPPGLLPPPRESAPEAAPVATGSETRRIGAVGIPIVSVPAAPAGPAAGTGAWIVRLPDGTERELGAVGIVLGRNPAPPTTLPDAVPVRVDDPGRSVSKTHAALAIEGGRVRVLDLHSTNGVAVTPPRGDATVVPADGLLADGGAVIALGDVAVALDRR